MTSPVREPAARRGEPCDHADEQHAGGRRESPVVGELAVQRLHGDAQEAALDAALLQSATSSAVSMGMVKPMPRPWPRELMPTTRPSRLTSGPPEEPRSIMASVWMKALSRLRDLEVAPHGGDDAERHRALEPVGVADGQHPLAHAQIRRSLPKSTVGSVDVGPDAQQRHVGLGVGADDARGVLAS